MRVSGRLFSLLPSVFLRDVGLGDSRHAKLPGSSQFVTLSILRGSVSQSDNDRMVAAGCKTHVESIPKEGDVSSKATCRTEYVPLTT